MVWLPTWCPWTATGAEDRAAPDLGPVAHDVLAHDKKHRFQLAAIQFVQDERRTLQVRAVVKGQQDQALCRSMRRGGWRFTRKRNQVARERCGDVDARACVCAPGSRSNP